MENMMDSDESPSASSTMIIHPGSKYLRIGLSSSGGSATSSKTLQVLHGIARRRRRQTAEDQADLKNRSSTATAPPPPEIESARLQLSHTLQTALRSDGTRRFATPIPTIKGYNKLVQGKELEGREKEEEQGEKEEDEDVLFDTDILEVSSKAEYSVNFPWRRGQLEVGSSLAETLRNLEDIWGWAFSRILGVDFRAGKCLNMSGYRAVLITPAVMPTPTNSSQKVISLLTTLLLCSSHFSFSSLILLPDHVATTFAFGIPTALVLDFGDQKTSISCVEDGISLPNSRVFLKYGGLDLTHALIHLLKQSGSPLPWGNGKPSLWELEFASDLKERYCHLDLDRCGPEERCIVWGLKKGKAFKCWFGDELLVVPLSYFNPDLLRGSMDEREKEETGVGKCCVVEDHLEDLLGDCGSASVAGCNKIKPAESAPETKIKDHHNHLLGIDQAVVQSIESFDDENIKRRFLCNILIVGGGFNFKGLSAWLQRRLSMLLPRMDIEVMTTEDENDPAWKAFQGAEVLLGLDTATELWITREEYQSKGWRVVRERSLIC